MSTPAVMLPTVPAPALKLPLSEVISAFSYALDLTEGQPPGHCIRACWIGMHIGARCRLPVSSLWNLYYTLLLKDAGCSSNAARLCELYGGNDRALKQDFKTVNSQHLLDIARFVFGHAGVGEAFGQRLKRWFNLAVNGEHLANELFSTRCERGADIARRIGLNEAIADGIRYLDEHWNGNGHPYRLKGDDIPMNSQIALLSQVFDVFYQIGGRQAALAEICQRSGSWFNPELVRLAQDLEQDENFWRGLASDDIETEIQALEPQAFMYSVDDDQLDRITEAFGMIVDVKSPYTHDHSSRVATYSVEIARRFGFDESRLRWLRRAAYLHDIGKLGVSNAILDKPGKLDDTEWLAVKQHAGLTAQILRHLTPFADIATLAAAHHEKLDGLGYPLGLKAEQISLETRIITIADIYDAITAARPYRDAIPVAKSLQILDAEAGKAVDGDCLAALKRYLADAGIHPG